MTGWIARKTCLPITVHQKGNITKYRLDSVGSGVGRVRDITQHDTTWHDIVLYAVDLLAEGDERQGGVHAVHLRLCDGGIRKATRGDMSAGCQLFFKWCTRETLEIVRSRERREISISIRATMSLETRVGGIQVVSRGARKMCA